VGGLFGAFGTNCAVGGLFGAFGTNCAVGGLFGAFGTDCAEGLCGWQCVTTTAIGTDFVQSCVVGSG